MSDTKKLTESELSDIRNVRTEFNDLVLFVGQLTLQKHLIEKDIKTAQNRFEELVKLEEQLIKTYSEKYGSGEINLETGIIT